VTPGPDQQNADPERSAREALDAARHEGDAGALVAAVTLLGERLLLARRAREALHVLAQGLRTAEIAGTGADPHLLAVLAAVQREVGSAVKAEKTATKALERSRPRSPARVQALRALGRDEEAWSELVAGELAPAAVPELTRPEPA
jgi:hypothetical protein